MAQRKGQRFSVEEKLRILEEARQPKTTVAEVCRRHGIHGTTFTRWEKQAKEGMRKALSGRRRDGRAEAREIERLREELEKKRRVIAEVVEENLALKGGS